MVAGHPQRAQLELELAVVGAVMIDDGVLAVALRCASIEAVSVENEMVLQVVCDLVLVMSTHVEIQAMVELWNVASQVWTSLSRLLATVTATLVVMLGLMSSGRTKEKACGRYGRDGCGTDVMSMGSLTVKKGADSGFEVDCYSRARLVKLLLPTD